MDDEHTLSILIKKDPIRGEDSIESFKEVLLIAKQRQVDMILLGGDLFHENKPSRKTLVRTMELFREHCLGSRPCYLEIQSDNNFIGKFDCANYEDPNINVSIPVFSIHGNHDDPTGDGNLCALDVLSTAGLINYFGKASQVDEITISPILLKKGNTKLALYGLGNIRDERLHRTFTSNKVKIMRPDDKWFNMMILHQNRCAHTPTNFIPEHFLDNSFNLIVWGHEHECRITPEYSSRQDFYVMQPGSTVATSLCEAESKPKYVGIVKIRGDKYEVEPVQIKSIRPMKVESICLQAVGHLNTAKSIEDYLKSRIDDLIKQCNNEWREINSEAPLPKPLIRLKVDYTGFSTLNPQRFGQIFSESVANPKDLLLLTRKRQLLKKNEPDVDNHSTFEASIQIEDLIRKQLEAQKLQIFPENILCDAVRLFAEKDDKDTINKFVDSTLKDIVTDASSCVESYNNEESLESAFSRFKQNKEEQFSTSGMHHVSSIPDRVAVSPNEAIELDIEQPKKVARTVRESRGRGRGSSAKAGTLRQTKIFDSIKADGEMDYTFTDML